MNRILKKSYVKKFLDSDRFILISVSILLIFGLVFMYSSSANHAQIKGLSDLFYFVSHFQKIILGLICLLITFYIPFSFWYKFSRPIGILSLLLLFVLLVAPNSVSLNGAKRWIFGIQPSEFAKLGFILFYSLKITEKNIIKDNFKKGLLNLLIVAILFFLLLLLQPDYSSGLILLIIAFSMLFYGGFKIKHILIIVSAVLPILSICILLKPYRLYRVLSFFNSSNNYQASQSLISLGSGGIFGAGMGEGTQKLGYLPMPFTDTAFSIIGEELGFLALMIFLIIFSLIVFRGFKIASESKEKYEGLVILGSTISIMVTGCMHIGVCIGFLPVTGQPLPFISYGGSALIINLALTGFILQGSQFNQNRIKKIKNY